MRKKSKVINKRYYLIIDRIFELLKHVAACIYEFRDEHDIVNKSLPFKLCPSANNRETHDFRAWQ